MARSTGPVLPIVRPVGMPDKLIFHVFGALAEFERELIRERTRAGLIAARARGRQGGRPRALASSQQVAVAQALYASKQHSIAQICQTLRISRATLCRYLSAPVTSAHQGSKRQT